MPFDIDEEYIIAAERALEAVLPDSYRKAMMVVNGGELLIGQEKWQLYPVLDKKTRKRLARTCNDIVRETRLMEKWADWPAQAIAIGANGYGDVLVFLRDGNRCSSEVYEWSHETGELRLLPHDFEELSEGK